MIHPIFFFASLGDERAHVMTCPVASAMHVLISFVWFLHGLIALHGMLSST